MLLCRLCRDDSEVDLDLRKSIVNLELEDVTWKPEWMCWVHVLSLLECSSFVQSFHMDTCFLLLSCSPCLVFSRWVVSDSLRPRGLQHARPPCPSVSPGVRSDSHPWERFVCLCLAVLGLCSGCASRVCPLLWAQASHCGGSSCCGTRALGAWASPVAQGPQSTGPVVVVLGLSCSATCGIFLDQGSNPCPVHCKVYS